MLNLKSLQDVKGWRGYNIMFNFSFLCTALIWQLMRAYTLSILTQLANTGSPMVEKEIVKWVNSKLASANKQSSVRGFQVVIN